MGQTEELQEKNELKINGENWLIIAVPSLKIAGYLHGLNAFPVLYILSAYSVLAAGADCDHSSVSHCTHDRHVMQR